MRGMSKGGTNNSDREKKGETVRTRPQLREPQRTQGRRVKGSVETLSRSRRGGAQSQVANVIANAGRKTQSQRNRKCRKKTQVDAGADANQTLALRDNECLRLGKVQNGLYTKLQDYFPSDPELDQSVILYLPTSPYVGRTYQGLESHNRVVFDESGLESALASRLLTSP